MRALTRLMTPWYRRRDRHGGTGADTPGSLTATAILDHGEPGIRNLLTRARADAAGDGTLAVLESAHAIIRDEVRPVYALDESHPASRTLARGTGSCSQRLAILESVARAAGVETRVRLMLVDRAFWYPRFPTLRYALPDPILLAWPEFAVEGGWRTASELFGSIGCRGGGAFHNSGGETLFEAVGRCAVDWNGDAGSGEYDLSRFVQRELGYFSDRDAAFALLGQTLCVPARVVVEPVLRRVAA